MGNQQPQTNAVTVLPKAAAVDELHSNQVEDKTIATPRSAGAANNAQRVAWANNQDSRAASPSPKPDGRAASARAPSPRDQGAYNGGTRAQSNLRTATQPQAGNAARGVAGAGAAAVGGAGSGSYSSAPVQVQSSSRVVGQNGPLPAVDGQGSPSSTLLQKESLVRVHGLQNSVQLNGEEGRLVNWDPGLQRWIVRLRNGEDKGIRAINLKPLGSPGNGGQTGAVASTADDGELEAILLQTNWSSIYQLFHQRFGIAILDSNDRGSVVKSAVEMTLSIVSKCFALLRSDPSGRLHCTPLHIAALQCSTEATEVIVRDLPHVVEKTHMPSHSALCPLHIAVLSGAQGVVELLLEGKANPNVRTLHDVSPLHLAATTSFELCQLLLAYKGDPLQRDVMGSNTLHYAASFKQEKVVEALLGVSANCSRLASDADKKKVTPLHISCALCAGAEDIVSAMNLLALGAKPWVTDVSGASARDVVAPRSGAELTRFFESKGNLTQQAAQLWLDERYLQRHIGGKADLEEDEGWHERKNDAGAGAGSVAPTQSAQAELHLRVEVERLKKELQKSQAQTNAMDQLQQELDHARQKVELLEKSCANQQRSFEALQTLSDTSRTEHQSQLAELQQRHAEERSDWEARLQPQLAAARNEALLEAARRAEARIKELESLVTAAEKRAEVADALADAANSARCDAERAVEVERRKRSIVASRENEAGNAEIVAKRVVEEMRAAQDAQPAGPNEHEVELEQRVQELVKEVQRLSELRAQEQAARGQAEGNEVALALRNLADRLGLVVGKEGAADAASTERLKNAILDEVQRWRTENTAKDAELQALREQLNKLEEEIASIRARRLEAEERCAKLAMQRQEAEDRSSAAAIQLDTKLRENDLRWERDVSQARSEQDAMRKQCADWQAKAREFENALQPTIEKFNAEIHALHVKFFEEQKLRRRYHNQIQDMKGAIRVFCRVRPMVAREQSTGDHPALRKLDAFSVELDRPTPKGPEAKAFQFDAVFDAACGQEEVFSECRDLVQSAVDGYNVTVFAYGQTGAGKTHTMYGTPADPGLAPRTIDTLFEVIGREQEGKQFSVKAYMVEVYKQDIVDLLSTKPGDQKKGLEVKRDVGRGIMFIDGVVERQVQSSKQLKELLMEGEKRRHVAATKMNSASSRSHLLLSIVVEGSVKESEQVIYGKITLCDLAGSERPKKSEVVGDALKEAIEINKSLSALGDVIESLTKGSKQVPYRNHKLTMLMQDSLGGSAKTLMFVNCSPAESSAEETSMSLKWASRARQVTNDVRRNADSKEVARLKQVIALMSQAQREEQELADELVRRGSVALPS